MAMGRWRQAGPQGMTEQETDDQAVRDQHCLLACVPYDDSLERRDRTLSHFLKCLTARGTCCDRALLPALVQFRIACSSLAACQPFPITEADLTKGSFRSSGQLM